MATLVFKLKHVPDEEAHEIKQLLIDHEISFYETTAGRWQVSLSGLWVKDKAQAQQALELIQEDQDARSKEMIEPSLKDYLCGYLEHTKQNPIESLFTLVAIVLVIGLSIFPFAL
ncbi:DUF6164 family protein [Marinomonas sp. C2222]|uniref:DUF6164 family protein n=1 Tax=Marinomonas sargassi TaxID=2984494 RepID=A0ABT2YVM0_9GAMM|nr:DUF6164 family protein [Marinomonas sargassi]MCV2403944.1 DUF6164 family protein [Marinomonas sargassi]